MPPTKTHSRKRKKRKFTSNQYTKRKSSASADASVPEDENTELSGDEEHVEGEKIKNFKSLSASERKLTLSQTILRMKAMEWNMQTFKGLESWIFQSFPVY